MRDTLLDIVRNKKWHECQQFLYKDWSRLGPEIFAPNVDAPWDAKPDESKIYDSLLNPIACAFCLSETDGIDLNPLMSECGLSSNAFTRGSICGKVFRNGEATYSCRECANDGTCVLCYECFTRSVHRLHKYRVNTSAGAGYCDCGDIEAWKSNPACDLHADALSADPDKERANQLPEDVSDRVRCLTRTILRYSTTVICWQQSDELPDVMKKQDCSVTPYQTMLFNDETHTYDSVIRALNLAIHCNEQQAMLLATIVDHEGRTSVRSGSVEACTRAKEEIQRRTQKDTNRRTEKTGPLEVRVMDSRLVAAQNFSLRLLSWLTSQIRNFPPLGSVIGSILLNENLEDDNDAMECDDFCQPDSMVVHVMKCDRALWKAARANFHQMFMATVLMNFEQKQEFTRQLIRHYKKIFLDFIDDDHEHAVSITSLTVQVFTVPTLARMLIAEESALEVIMNVLIDFCQRYLKEPEKKRFDFSVKSFPNVLRRAMFMMNDFKYLLTVVPSQSEWTPILQDKFYDGCLAFIRFLSYLQGMDEVKRQSGEHQAWELEWETAFNIHLRMQSAITMVIAWIISHKDVHARLFRYTLEQLCNIVKDSDEFSSKVKIEVNGSTAMCIPFDVTRDRISVHQPLWRLMAGLFTAPADYIENAIIHCTPEGNLEGRRAMLYEMPMRVLVLCAQCHAQMWRRNGFSLVNQIHNYFSPLCRSEMFDKDILMMQVGAALSSPDVFLIRFLHRFGLYKWAELGFEEQKMSGSPNSSHEELSKSTVILAEEMLHCLISIIEERYTPGVGKSTREDALRREVLHILATGPKPFSKIDREVPDCPLVPEVSLEEVVKEICEFKKPTKTSAGVFYLKKSVWKDYSPFFYHYSKTHISQAEQYQLKERAGSDKSIASCPPPKGPEFEPFFAPIRCLLLSPVLLRILRAVLERTAKRSRYSSDGLLHRALYIIGLGLNEQSSDDKFDFITEAEKENILQLMENLEGKVEVVPNADLLIYLIQLYRSLKTKADGLVTVKREEKDVISDLAKKTKRAAMAAKMRKQAMDQMSRMQKQFLASNRSLIEKEGKVEADSSSCVRTVIEDEEPLGILSDESGFPVCLGKGRLHVDVVHCRRLTCILCQEAEVIKYNGKPLVCVGLIQQSSLFAQRNKSLNNPSDAFLSADLPVGLDVSTCGHTMHFDCYQRYSELLKARERGRPRQALAVAQRLIDVEAGEYLCPLCKRLSNAAIPLIPALSLLEAKRCDDHEEVIGSFDNWVTRLEVLVGDQYAATKSVKTHSRKRSHSERFTVGSGPLRGCSETGAENNLSSSVPSVNALPMTPPGETDPDAMDVEDATEALPERDFSDVEEDEQNEQRFMPDGRLLGMLQLPLPSLPNVVHKIREIMGHAKHSQDNVPKPLGMQWEMIRFFLKVACSIRNSGEPPINPNISEMETVTVWQMAAFTLRSVAVVLRRENKPLFGALNARQRECLFAISRISAVSAFNCRPQNLKALLGTLLEPLIGPSKRFEQSLSLSPEVFASGSELPPASAVPFSSHATSLPSSPVACSPPASSSKLPFSLLGTSQSSSAVPFELSSTTNVLSVDMLTLALELAMCAGWSWVDGKPLRDGETSETFFVPSGSQQEHYALRLALLGHIYQIFATFDRGDLGPILAYPTTWPETNVKFDCIISRLLRIIRGEDFVCDLSELRQALFVGIVEFLRPLALFFHAITLVPPPEALKAPSYDEFQPLCRYLGLPSDISEILSDNCVERLFTRWRNSGQQDKSCASHCVRQPVMENNLIELPDDFSELINTAANFRCPTSLLDDHVSSMPTLCLICGSLLCSQSYCCQRVVNKETKGACSYHLQSCSGTSGGLFLRIRDCQIILLTPRARGCFMAAPYVDEFGETDFGFRRGNPLHLNKEMFAKLERIWLHQSINEEVVNQNEIDSRNRFEWQHF